MWSAHGLWVHLHGRRIAPKDGRQFGWCTYPVEASGRVHWVGSETVKLLDEALYANVVSGDSPRATAKHPDSKLDRGWRNDTDASFVVDGAADDFECRGRFLIETLGWRLYCTWPSIKVRRRELIGFAAGVYFNRSRYRRTTEPMSFLLSDATSGCNRSGGAVKRASNFC